jgi:hypothetical protein
VLRLFTQWQAAAGYDFFTLRVAKKKQPEPVACVWWVMDGVTSPTTYPSFADAAALGTVPPMTLPRIIWGSVSSALNLDGIADYVHIYWDTMSLVWRWRIGTVGFPIADGFPIVMQGFATSQLALAAAQSSAFLPAGFCVE